jgi:hypothetical protein
MAGRIGPRRLQKLINAGIDPRTLTMEQQLSFARAMAYALLPPVSESGPRRVPRHLRPRCTARRRDGHRCQAKVAWDTKHDRARNTKCRVHGGMAPGPRTPEGRQRIAASNRRRAQARRQAQRQAEVLAAQARALEAYQAALTLYEATLAHPMQDTRFKIALLQMQWRKVQLRYQEYLDCNAAST